MRYFSATVVTISVGVLATVCACSAAQTRDYQVELVADFKPKSGGAEVTLKITQQGGQLRQLNFSAPVDFFAKFQASEGKVERLDQQLVWQVPREGGSLTWMASLNVPKGDAFDARITPDWAILRFEDFFPRLTSKALKGSRSNFTVRLEGPKNWSFETRYGGGTDRSLEIESARLNFDRPTGWLIAGVLGIRRDSIAERSVTVAAPVGSRAARVPTLAFLRWTLPEFVKVFPSLPARLLVVNGNEKMWRGGLSGPASLYMHTGRPLISENGTSTVLHELVHIATRINGGVEDDWIVEGLAEYYSLEILRRSNGVSQARFDSALKSLRLWVKESNGRLASPSSGANTAAAVLLFHDIAQELAQQLKNTRSEKHVEFPLDKAIQHLLDGRIGSSVVSRAELQASIIEATGITSAVLESTLVSLATTPTKPGS